VCAPTARDATACSSHGLHICSAYSLQACSAHGIRERCCKRRFRLDTGEVNLGGLFNIGSHTPSRLPAMDHDGGCLPDVCARIKTKGEIGRSSVDSLDSVSRNRPAVVNRPILPGETNLGDSRGVSVELRQPSIYYLDFSMAFSRCKTWVMAISSQLGVAGCTPNDDDIEQVDHPYLEHWYIIYLQRHLSNTASEDQKTNAKSLETDRGRAMHLSKVVKKLQRLRVVSFKRLVKSLGGNQFPAPSASLDSHRYTLEATR
jgi:hypothetical protein